jgi:Tfp pilus assembly protein PilV
MTIRRPLSTAGQRSGASTGGLVPSSSNGFTIVEVMMAATILVVGFVGMIQAVTIGSEMLATARRQTLAAQILEHEIGKLRLLPWDVSTTAPNELCINDLTTATTTVAVDSHFAASIAACGLTSSDITLSRTTAEVTTDLKEVTFTLTWTKSGTNTAAAEATGNWVDQLAFYRPSAIGRIYTRKSTALFGKYGLNLSTQRS